MINKGIVLFYFLFTVSDVFSAVINPLPQNQAVLTGKRSAFSCSSDKAAWNFITWSVVPVGESTAIPIYIGGEVQDIYRDACEVTLAGPKTSMLTIKAANESMAGTYFCTDGVPPSYSFQLIVYKSNPVCTSNATSVSCLSPGQMVLMTCSFSYTANSSVFGVNMVWATNGSVTKSGSLSYSTSGIFTTAVSTVNQIVNYSSPFPAFECQTSFRETGFTGSSATNAPSYVNITTIPEKEVCYFNPNCTIKGAEPGGKVPQGKIITCEADANPPPNYRWLNGTNATLSNSSTMLILNDGQYTCAAWNNVSSCQPSIILTTYTTTLPPTTTTPTTITPPSTASSSVAPPSPSEGQSQSGGLSQDTKNIIIGVVVGVGGAILLAVLIAIICCCMKKKNKSADNYKDDRNAKRMNDYPPPYDGHVGPQRNSSPDVVDYSPPSMYRSSYDGSSPSQPKYIGDDNLNYAQIQVDNQPRSRQPLQVPQNSNYVEVALA